MWCGAGLTYLVSCALDGMASYDPVERVVVWKVRERERVKGLEEGH